MKSEIIKIDSSLGVIIPSEYLSLLCLKVGSAVDIQLTGDNIEITDVSKIAKSRTGWETIYKEELKVQESEKDFSEGLSNDFDENEWTW